jgi:hypothetical protein
MGVPAPRCTGKRLATAASSHKAILGEKVLHYTGLEDDLHLGLTYRPVGELGG